MDNELYPAAALWFIDRFCPTSTIQIFVRRLNNLEGMSSDAGQKMRQRRDQFARYDFTFLPIRNFVLVMPNKPESEWAQGIIWRARTGEYLYRTSNRFELELLNKPESSIEKELDNG